MGQQAGTSHAEKGVIARLSLEHKLPMLMGSLLLLGVFSVAIASYMEVRRSAAAAANQRAVSVAQQLSDIFRQSGAQMRGLIRSSADATALTEYTRRPGVTTRAAAVSALEYQGPAADQVIGSELRDGQGRTILSTVPAALRFDSLGLGELLSLASRDSASIGAFRVVPGIRDTLVYPVAAPVAGGAAYLVRWRRLVGSRRTREQITRLIGSDASLYFGNPDGRLGTDLERIVSHAPPPAGTSAPAVREYRRDPDRATYLSATAAVPGTPWMVAVDIPMEAIDAPIGQFLQRLVLIAAVVMLLGLGAAWIISRRITRPLVALTDAAAAISDGDFSRSVRIDRSDELGRLGTAFSAMASEVRHTRENLEQRIGERTRDLNATLVQLKDAQETLVRRERLALLGQLSSGVGHELRNPLGVMTNAVYYLKAVLATSPANVHEYLDILQQQITLSEKIVGDLLDFARQKPPQRRPTFLREATESQLQKLGRTDSVRFDLDVPDHLPPVLVDPIQLGQVILNLITNATQSLNGHGRVTIRARENGSRVFYEIEDTGPGIPATNLEKIFEPLFTTKARGIGLGLSVSRMLARANGGDLVAASAPGSGATFTLTLEKAGGQT